MSGCTFGPEGGSHAIAAFHKGGCFLRLPCWQFSSLWHSVEFWPTSGLCTGFWQYCNSVGLLEYRRSQIPTATAPTTSGTSSSQYSINRVPWPLRMLSAVLPEGRDGRRVRHSSCPRRAGYFLCKQDVHEEASRYKAACDSFWTSSCGDPGSGWWPDGALLGPSKTGWLLTANPHAKTPFRQEIQFCKMYLPFIRITATRR